MTRDEAIDVAVKLADAAWTDPAALEVLHDHLLEWSVDYREQVESAMNYSRESGDTRFVAFHPVRAERQSSLRWFQTFGGSDLQISRERWGSPPDRNPSAYNMNRWLEIKWGSGDADEHWRNGLITFLARGWRSR